MSDNSKEVPLPQSVEELLKKICADQNLPSPNLKVRQELASLGEEEALSILKSISRCTVRNLTALIVYMIHKAPASPQKNILRSSPNQSPSSSRQFSAQGGSVKSVPRSPVMQNLRISLISSPERRDIRETLGELEFRKAFLILNYIGGEELENVTTADQIRRLKDLHMGKFELEVWRELGQKYINQEDRRYIDWDTGRTHYYHCYVSPDGSFRFKGPYLNKTRTHLQRVLGDDNVLMVKFAEDVAERGSVKNLSKSYAVYNKLAKDGIVVGLRRYHFFVFKDGGKEEKKKNPTTSPVKCIFVRLESEVAVDNCKSYKLFNKTIYETRNCFMHAHSLSSVATYMARFALILSKTINLNIDLSTVNIQRIEDVCCRDDNGNIMYRDGKPLIHTDGTGYISEDLASECPKDLFKGQFTRSENVEGFSGKNIFKNGVELNHQERNTRAPPLLIQFRLFYNGCAVKGTFLVNRQLPLRTIQIHKSMIKVDTDSKLKHLHSENSLEIVGTSNPPKKTYLSRNLIALLSYGGVPKEYFMNILMTALNDVKIVFSSKRAALKVAINHGEMDDFLVARMILSGIPLEEPYLQYRLSLLIKEEKKSLKGGRLHVPECYYLMGTADPTGSLESGQVCIILESGQISGEVLVYRNPGLHFGDIHALEATYVKAIEDVVGNAKYGIFFSTKGPRSVADEIAGGDFDGDMYWVSRNPQLLDYFHVSQPWTPIPSMQKVSNKAPSEFSSEDLEDELFKLFLKIRFEPSYTKSLAADSWLTLMDQLLMLGDDDTEKKNIMKADILQLIDIYYDALDAPKKGGKVDLPDELKVTSFPHFMERGKNSYMSTSILGLIYDTAKSCQEEDVPNVEVKKFPGLDADISEEILKKWKSHYEDYRSEMRAALQLDPEGKNEAAESVIHKYREILYGASDFDKSSRRPVEIFEEAVAVYHITYDYAMRQDCVKYCSFAWRVAGSALFKVYASKQSETLFLCLPSVLREVL